MGEKRKTFPLQFKPLAIMSEEKEMDIRLFYSDSFFEEHDSKCLLMALSTTHDFAISIQAFYNKKKIGDLIKMRRMCFSWEPVVIQLKDKELSDLLKRGEEGIRFKLVKKVRK